MRTFSSVEKSRLADEQPLAGEELVEHDADREDVAAPVDRQPAHLLGRHVAELALQDSGLGRRRLAGRLGDAEVDELDLALVADEHVLRRDVAVDEVQLAPLPVALVVRVVEPLADLHHDVTGQRDRQRLAAAAHAVEDRAEIAPVDVLERDEVALLDLPEVEDLGDVRVLQLHGDLRLVDEHRDELFVLRDVRQDALDRQQALEALDAEGLGLEHLGHTSHVDPLEEVVLPEGDGLLQDAHNTGDFSVLQLHFRLVCAPSAGYPMALPAVLPTVLLEVLAGVLLGVPCVLPCLSTLSPPSDSTKTNVAPAATNGGATKNASGTR